MGWTSDKPTVAGWYYGIIHAKRNSVAYFLQVMPNNKPPVATRTGIAGTNVFEYVAEWLGPFDHPFGFSSACEIPPNGSQLYDTADWFELFKG